MFHLIESNFEAITTWWINYTKKRTAIKIPFDVNVVDVCASLNDGGRMWGRFYLWDKFQFKLKLHNFNTALFTEATFFQAINCFHLLVHIHDVRSVHFGSTSNEISRAEGQVKAKVKITWKHETKVEKQQCEHWLSPATI